MSKKWSRAVPGKPWYVVTKLTIISLQRFNGFVWFLYHPFSWVFIMYTACQCYHRPPSARDWLSISFLPIRVFRVPSHPCRSQKQMSIRAGIRHEHSAQLCCTRPVVLVNRWEHSQESEFQVHGRRQPRQQGRLFLCQCLSTVFLFEIPHRDVVHTIKLTCTDVWQASHDLLVACSAAAESSGWISCVDHIETATPVRCSALSSPCVCSNPSK